MKVGVDLTPLVQTRAGTARHVRGLVQALEGRPDLELVGVSARGTGRVATVRRDAIWYPLRLAGATRDLDVLHCTTFRAPLRPRCPLVVTVHDLGVVRFPDAFPRWHGVTGRRALASAVQVADVIVAVSEFTRAELVEVLDVDPDRVHVVPNGVDPVFRREGERVEGDYVLAVGTLEPRKNLGVAVEATRLAGCELRVAGMSGWGGVSVDTWVGEPSDEGLAALIRGARCLVYPSLYEGFGLPILEAMACGTPVVTSRGGATEEVAGGAAVLVDANDPAAVAAGIVEAGARRDELVPAGLAHASGFTWAAAADRVEALWRSL